jgi:hypothetical protein
MAPTCRSAFAVLVAPLLLACSGTEPEAPTIRLIEIARGIPSPVYLTAPPGDARLFIVEQGGRLRIIENGELVETPFLDIRDSTVGGGESGLLGLAFHPQYATNGFFYVNYTDLAGDTRIARYQVSPDRNVANPSSADSILYFDQPFSNHNGGHVLFGPDGMLYIPTGDGGDGGDPFGNGQNPATLLGKILRIDVDGGDPYAIPPDNPFATSGAGLPEIWALGLRNPWRVAFDPPSGLLYVADVGQNQWEEVNVQPATAAPLNYGWDVMEGAHCFSTTPCNASGLIMPAVEYNHSDGCSITGGYVYRGAAEPALDGQYFYADLCSGWIRSFRFEGGAAEEHRTAYPSDIGAVTSFGLDAAAELYVLVHQGVVYRIAQR